MLSPQDDSDRRPRFSSESSAREPQRAASQPPRSTGHNSSPLAAYRNPVPIHDPNNSSPILMGAKTWGQRYTQAAPPLNRALTSATTPTRSASFSAMGEQGGPQNPFASSVRADRAFPSTFEDDEDDYGVVQNGGGPDSRSRSHSLATPGRLTLNTSGLPGSQTQWNVGARYGEIAPPNRYSPHPSSAIPISRPYGGGQDVSNMSPFVREVPFDEHSALRDLWGTTQFRGDDTGPASGTTSRRHSVSVVQPRRGLGAFDFDDDDSHLAYGSASRSLMFSDDDLASGLSMLNFKDGPSSPRDHGPPSQPASLPIYGVREPGHRYIPMNLPVGALPAQPPAPRSFASQSSVGGVPERASPEEPSELGRGVPLHAVPPSCPLYIVEFKAGRTDLFYSAAGGVRVGDLVIVEADRGRDLGKVVNDSITTADVEAFQRREAPVSPGGTHTKRDINPKRIYGKAQAADTQSLVAKMQDEAKALQLCQSKVKLKKLPMEVVDAEYQWDRRKLTFYFISDKRIDFRELVRELFRLYKTRIWMASLQGPTSE